MNSFIRHETTAALNASTQKLQRNVSAQLANIHTGRYTTYASSRKGDIVPTPIGTSGNRRVTCQNCGTEMSFMLSEVRVGARIQGSDDDEYESVVKCPTVRCGRT